MSEQDFLKNIADILEVEPESINFDTDFRNDIDDWDSLKGYGMIVFFDDECGKKVPVSEFLKAGTIGDLYKLVTER